MHQKLFRVLGAAALAATLLLGACSDDDDDGEGTTTDSTATTSDGSGTGTTEDDETTTTTGSSGSASTTAPVVTSTTAEEGVGVIEINIVGGNVEGGVRRQKVKQGAQVTIRAVSDTAAELHVHTYDQRIDLVPGQSADLIFLARIPGVFEVELEEQGKKVLELEVGP
ncbi:MAG: hypothetical protein M3Q68_10120 [Actinomycetota bacterium]|nr:hypothetical protein [Actinomycetota bacterium]